MPPFIVGAYRTSSVPTSRKIYVHDVRSKQSTSGNHTITPPVPPAPPVPPPPLSPKEGVGFLAKTSYTHYTLYLVVILYLHYLAPGNFNRCLSPPPSSTHPHPPKILAVPPTVSDAHDPGVRTRALQLISVY